MIVNGLEPSAMATGGLRLEKPPPHFLPRWCWDFFKIDENILWGGGTSKSSKK